MTLKEQISWCKAQIKSGYEVVVIRSILARLQGLEKKSETPGTLYSDCLSAYKTFLEGRNIPLVMDGRQGKALKQIIEKLISASTDKTITGVLISWHFILNNWQLTGEFIGRQIKLTDIDRNLQEILDKIRNGASKKQANINEAQRFHNELTQNERNHNS